MDKIKEKLHIGSRRKSQPENDTHTAGTGTIEGKYTHTHTHTHQNYQPISYKTNQLSPPPPRQPRLHRLGTRRDAPHERVAYLQEFEHSDKHDAPKKGGLIEKLIARGNKRTEEQIVREAREREERERVNRAGAETGTGAEGTIR
ncbi:hypothetical protein GQ44DRAFT_742121 [Phaeosphaeriaceae sp. PMI808]|nr:hypothetical protein GQ44DRAFT_742121 [Phaeosphaeriaceae sp. PMI808]